MTGCDAMSVMPPHSTPARRSTATTLSSSRNSQYRHRCPNCAYAMGWISNPHRSTCLYIVFTYTHTRSYLHTQIVYSNRITPAHPHTRTHVFDESRMPHAKRPRYERSHARARVSLSVTRLFRLNNVHTETRRCGVSCACVRAY